MTGTEIATMVRPLVNDVDSSSMTDATLLRFINEGVRRIYDMHPEARVQTNGVLRVYADMTALGDTVGLDDLYEAPLVEWCAFRFFDSDGGDTRDKSRASEHFGHFGQLMGAA